MQVQNNDLYSRIAFQHNIDINKVKFVGDTVFSNLASNMKRPESLILKIKYLGSFFLRKKKVDNEIRLLKTKIDKPNYFHIKGGIDELKSLLSILEKRREEYDKYISKKGEIKKIRHANQKIVESIDAQG